MYTIKLRHVHETTCRGKAISIIHFCVCVGRWVWQHGSGCALVHIVLLIQHETHHHIVTSFAAPLAPPYFLTLCHKRQDLQKKVTGHKTYILILQKFYLEHFSFSEEFSEILSSNFYMQSTCYSCQILMKLRFSGQIKKHKHQISSKSVQWEPISMQTYIHNEASSCFLKFCKCT